MSQSQPHESVVLGCIEYSINEEEKTASLIRYQISTPEIIIPRSIKHKSKEYTVTRISYEALKYFNSRSVLFEPNSELRIIEKNAFSSSNMLSIMIPSHVTQIGEGAFSFCTYLYQFEFEPNSELRTIEKDAFYCSYIESIKIPASVVELKDGWCRETKKLIHVDVDAGNKRYSSIGGKCIIGKSDIEQEDYDTFVFMTRDSVEVNIPSTIKIIGPHAFSCSALASILIPSHITKICEDSFSICKQLTRVEFEPNSELRTIEKDAFSYSNLVSIVIPSHVTKIGKRAFYSCTQLTRVEFEPNSELRTIEEYAFSESSIESIKIPASVVELKDGWCRKTKELIHVDVDAGNKRYSSIGGKCIIGKSDIEQEDYDTFVFMTRDSVEVNIPSTIKIIGPHAFSCSALASIVIPSHITKISEDAFSFCQQLTRVEFEPNSELRTIEKCAFQYSNLVSIVIPSHVTQICKRTFFDCFNLSRVEFEPNSELRKIESSAFYFSKITSILIPKNVKYIHENAFVFCSRLQIIEIEGNSVNEPFDRNGLGESQIIMVPAGKQF